MKGWWTNTLLHWYIAYHQCTTGLSWKGYYRLAINYQNIYIYLLVTVSIACLFFNVYSPLCQYVYIYSFWFLHHIRQTLICVHRLILLYSRRRITRLYLRIYTYSNWAITMTTLQRFIRTFKHHNRKNSKIRKRCERMLSIPLYTSIVEIAYPSYVKWVEQDARPNIRRIEERSTSAGRRTLLKRTIMYSFSSLRKARGGKQGTKIGATPISD